MKTGLMKFVGVSVVVGAMALGHGIGALSVAQDAGKAEVKAEKGEKGAGKKSTKSEDRLPPNYGKIGLSDDQRKKIYAVQDRYEAEIKELQRKLADVRAKQQAEVDAVLTPAQRQLLEEHIESSKKKSAEKKKGGKEAEKSGNEKAKSE